MPTRSSSPEQSKKKLHGRRHDHARFHQEQKEKRELEERAELEKKAVGDLVIATINGQVVSWINQYDGSNEAKAKPTPGPAANPAAAVPAPAPAAVSATPGSPGPAKTSKVVKPKDNSKAKGSPAGIARGDWGQVAYYNSEDRSAHGVTFLNNLGGQGSGVFDMLVLPMSSDGPAHISLGLLEILYRMLRVMAVPALHHQRYSTAACNPIRRFLSSLNRTAETQIAVMFVLGASHIVSLL